MTDQRVPLQDTTVELHLPVAPRLADTGGNPPLTYADDPYEATPCQQLQLPPINSLQEAIQIVRLGEVVLSVFLGNLTSIDYRGQLLAAMMEYHGEPGQAVVEMLDSIVGSLDVEHQTLSLAGVLGAPSIELGARYVYVLGNDIWPHRHIPSTHVIAACLKLYNAADDEAYDAFIAEQELRYTS